MEIEEAALLLKQADNFLILSHQFPDGDTFGCASALCRGLRRLGKRAAVRCSDPVGEKYRFLFKDLPDDDFEPEWIVAVDVADKKLLGEPLLSRYGDRIDLCIDHHSSNTLYAQQTLLDSRAAAACEIIYALLKLLGIAIDEPVAEALYTGITTDTGCFRYINTTARSYRIAADLVDAGIDAPAINDAMFGVKSHAKLEMERRVLETIEYACGGKVAVIRITKKMIQESGAGEDDLEGLATIPREIEGVLIGVTLREKNDGTYKVSLRARRPANASQICAKFGGGGHPGAAGCTLDDPLEEAARRMVGAVSEYLESNGWL